MGSRRRALTAVLLAMGATTGGAAAAQDVDAVGVEPLPRGVVVERMVAVADSSQSYALYLPSRYEPGRPWPVLFVMDPRGRALVPLERFVAPGERYGYIVMSSWNSASDSPGPDPNEPALAAMLSDAQTLFSVDPRRLYLAGFSGTARAAWGLAIRLPGNVAGVIGVGGGFPGWVYRTGLAPAELEPDLGFFGVVGTRDFTYEEMWRVEEMLDGAGIPNALAFFEGPHAWPPRELFARAVAWMEVRAMKTGLRAVDRTLVDSLRGADEQRARTLEAAGERVAALREYETLAELYEGLADVAEAREHAARLRETGAVTEELERIAALRSWFWDRIRHVDEVLMDVQLGTRDADPDRIADALGLPALLAEAGDEADALTAGAATRLLEDVYVKTSFYQPRIYIQQGRTERALAVLEVADRIFPDRARACLLRARALAAAGREDAAVAAVRCALERGASRALLRDDPGLAPLRHLPAFRALAGAAR